jgi:hypothetical protein
LGYSEAYDEVVSHRRSNRGDNFRRKPDPLLEIRAAVAIVAYVGLRPQELVQQISMRRMDFDAAEANLLRQQR